MELKRYLKLLKKNKTQYSFSFDIDAMDPTLTPSTGTPAME